MSKFFRSIFHSFSHAWRGIRLAFRTERSFRIQIGIALVVVIGLLILPLARFEQVVLLLAIAAVLVLELVNSMVERLVDLFKPRLNEYVGDIKDLMAGAVLLVSGFAAVIGLLILWPIIGKVFLRV